MTPSALTRYLCNMTLALASVLPNGSSAYGQICSPGYPSQVRGYDSREVSLLPRFCVNALEFRDRVPGGNNPEEIKRWFSVIGPTFSHMHHYCWGLMETNRAILQACTKDSRRSLLGSALEEFDYVIKRAPADFVLLPEILTKKGENQRFCNAATR